MVSSQAFSCLLVHNTMYVGYEEGYQCASSVPQIKCLKGRCWKHLETIFMGNTNTVSNSSFVFQSVKIQTNYFIF